jgi:hypothetical protein
MVKNNFMINELLKNEAIVKKLEAIAQELEVMKETKGDFSFFLPKLILNIEGLMKMYHKDGSNTFDYVTKHNDSITETEHINFLKLIQKILLLKSNKY